LSSIRRFESFDELFSRDRKILAAQGKDVKNKVALKWCKEEKSIDGREVSGGRTGDFHKLINICVENLMWQKYFLRSSAHGLPCGWQGTFDWYEIEMVEYKSGCTR
jgi:hypothetical protein